METLQRTANRGSLSTGFDVGNSTAFDRTRTEYYTRNVSSSGSRTKGTISMWAKRGTLNVTQYFFEMGNVDNDDGRLFARFGSDNTLRLATGSTVLRNTVRVFRDSSAWYHFLVVIDTTQSTANDRVKLYVNGVQETIFSTTNNYSLNGTTGLNFGRQVIGYSQIDNAAPYDGNICEVVIQDGVTSAPTEFGEFSDTGQWIPIDPTGVTFGTNGCYLDFRAGGTDMGFDYSGNSNNFTANNIGSQDQSEDTCTNNFCTLNFNTAILQGNTGNTGGGFSGGNLLRQGSGSSGNNGSAAAGTQGINPFVDAKWYFEVESTAANSGSGTDVGYGWIGESLMVSDSHANNNVYAAGTIRYASQTAHSAGDIQSVLFEGGTTPVIKFYRNNGLVHTATHGTDWTAKDEFMFPYVWVKGTSQEGVMNFGNPIQENAVASPNTDPNGYGAFEFDTKSGYALNSKNLAEYASLTSVDDPSEYCQSLIYAGTGNNPSQPTTHTNTGNSDLQPDFIWFFEFSAGYGTAAMDSTRTRSQILFPSEVNAEVTQSNTTYDLVSFDSNGFKVGAPSEANSTNGGTTQKLALQWKANGGTTSSFTESGNNPGGTIQTNTSAGFSIISYTGTGGPGNIAHGLPSAPELVIFKNRGTTNVWATYHVSLGDDLKLVLNTNAAQDADGSFMNSTIPDGTNIRVGDSNNPNTNADSGTYMCYAWSPIKGYSKFGLYEGQGNSEPENTFVYTGFTPRHVWIKRKDSANDWIVHDISLGTLNGTGTIKGNFGNAQTAALRINNSSGIDGWGDIDIYSNGFCCRSAAGATCANGGDYIYAAWAYNPFITSSAGGSHPTTAV
jgi:hypothetical protein